MKRFNDILPTLILLALFFAAMGCGKLKPEGNAAPPEIDKKPQAGNCEVTLIDVEIVNGLACRLDTQVALGVVSVDPEQIRCAKIKVTCKNDKGERFEIEGPQIPKNP